MTPRVRITYVRSAIGSAADQKRTVAALGLRRLHQSVEHPDSPSLRGMLHKVRHLVAVAEAAGAEARGGATPRRGRPRPGAQG